MNSSKIHSAMTDNANIVQHLHSLITLTCYTAERISILNQLFLIAYYFIFSANDNTATVQCFK